MSPEIEAKLATLPSAPGVYLFKGAGGEVLYVGKARSLRSRVRSYFQAGRSDTRFFIARLERELADLETLVVGSEKEAALLENTLIKQHHPRYNVKLRDDKDYLSLRLDPQQAWPRLEVVRRPQADGALYFGPYHSATAARATLRLVNRHFQLRTCTDSELNGRTRPCLQHQIKRCPAPCVLDVDRRQYAEQVDDVAMFLDGRHDELIALLTDRMGAAAAALRYERAAELRDQLRAVERVREQNRVAVVQNLDQDVIGLYRRADQAEVAALSVRAGKLTHVRTFALKGVSAPDDELVAAFVSELYAEGSFVPEEVLLPLDVEAMQGLAELLSDRRGRKVRVLAPKRGSRAQLVEMARDNAAHAYQQKARAREDLEERLGQLQQRLRLPALPRRIECVDVSHTGGQDTVASIVAVRDGQPDRRRYRSFHVKRVSGGDDYSAMYEVLSRRFRRGKRDEQGWELPDLMVVDGGKGQLNVACSVLRDLSIEGVPVAGLAKEKENAFGDKLVDRVYLPGQKNPIQLRENSAALGVLAMARDEAHRASNQLRLKLGKRRRLRSELDEIPGVGPKTRARLLKNLGSVRAVKEAEETALRAAGATRSQARAIVRHFRGPAEAERPLPAVAERAEPVYGAGRELEQAEDAAVDNAFQE